ncbi:MAG: CDGSH iron-sulfur domain-containing protein [Paracoccaceae bacterium]
MAETDPIILVAEDGPLRVRGGPTLTMADGTVAETGQGYALCRCGLSGTKPFCDGSHRREDWSEPATEGRDGWKDYTGVIETAAGEVPVTVGYSPRICSHAKHCVATGDAFDPDRKPWIDPSEGTLAQLRAATGRCPSGALRLAVGEAQAVPFTAPHDAAGIRVAQDGPLEVDHVALDAPFADGATSQKYVLCRCGRTGNAPFCDGTHSDIGWTDPGTDRSVEGGG